MLAWRFDESMVMCERALALARGIGAHAVELRALRDLGRDLAYLGRADEGVGLLQHALGLAEEGSDPLALLQANVALTDVLMMLGRPGQSARIGERGLEIVRRYGIDGTLLLANIIEALLAIGDWDGADSATAAALRAGTGNFPYMLFMLRADLDAGRGNFDAARAHLDAALVTLREDRGQGVYDVFLAELALGERRWADAEQGVRDGLARARSRQAAQLKVWFCAKGLRAQAELAALARARRRHRRRRHMARPRRGPHRRRPALGPRGLGRHAERRRLALPRRGRVRARVRRRTARLVVGGRRDMGAAGTSARRGLLPLARGRGARGRRGVAR